VTNKGRYDPVGQIEENRRQRDFFVQSVDLTKDNINKIKKSAGTKIIKYPEYEDSYNYVDEIFPTVGVKDVVIYQVSPKYLSYLGYGGVGGFFEKINKSVVISSYNSILSSSSTKAIRAKITKDEVIVHELIHYCYEKEGRLTSNSHLKEEFAYGWSWGYLRGKGYSNDEIIEFNYLPYLYLANKDEATLKTLFSEGVNIKKYASLSNTKKHKILGRLHKKIHEKCLELSYDMGRKIISIYSDKINNNDIFEKKEKLNRSYFLDLDMDE
jgi:hypothetical protein